MFKLVKISSTKLIEEHFKLPDGYNWGEDEPFKEGEWVTISDGKIARITGSDVVASHNTFPIYLSNTIDPAPPRCRSSKGRTPSRLTATTRVPPSARVRS